MAVTIDTSGFERRMTAFERGRLEAKKESVREGLAVLAGILRAKWPKDTNRSYRGFLEAFKAVGVRGLTLPPLKPSREREKIIEALGEQLEAAQKSLEFHERLLKHRYTDKGWHTRPGSTGARLKSKIRRLEKRRDKAAEQLNRFLEDETAGFIDDAGLLRHWQARKGNRISRSISAYGGTGTMLVGPGFVTAELVNKEPHARFVERKRKIVYRANLELKSRGVRRMSRKYLDHLRRSGGQQLSEGEAVAA